LQLREDRLELLDEPVEPGCDLVVCGIG